MTKKDIKYILISLLLLSASFGFVRNTANTIKNNQRYKDLENTVSGLQKEKALLQENLAYQESDEFIEQEARNKLNMVKDNEEIFVLGSESQIPEKDLSENATSEAPLADAPNINNLLLWFDVLF